MPVSLNDSGDGFNLPNVNLPSLKSVPTKAMGVVASLGITQTIGIAGLAILGIKNLVNAVALPYFKHQLALAQSAKNPQQVHVYTQKIEAIHISRTQDQQTAKAMGLLLVPAAGAQLAYHFGDLVGGLAAGVNDVCTLLGFDEKFNLANFIKSSTYPLSGGKLPGETKEGEARKRALQDYVEKTVEKDAQALEQQLQRQSLETQVNRPEELQKWLDHKVNQVIHARVEEEVHRDPVLAENIMRRLELHEKIKTEEGDAFRSRLKKELTAREEERINFYIEESLNAYRDKRRAELQQELSDPTKQSQALRTLAEEELHAAHALLHEELSHGGQVDWVEDISIRTGDGREIVGTYARGKGADGQPVPPNAPTALLFHGNSMTHEGMVEIAQFYQEKGMNVVMITMGGYGHSAPGTETSERTAYLDAQATVDFIKREKGVQENDKLVAHGTSIGGSLAFFAARNNPGIHIIADQTFTSMRDVSINTVLNLHEKQIPAFVRKLKDATKVLFGGIVSKYFPSGVQIGGLSIPTDGLNNLEKAKGVQGAFFAISTQQDRLMGWKPNAEGVQERNFANKLARAYFQEQSKNQNPHCQNVTEEDLQVSMTGGHMNLFTRDPAARSAIERHLSRIGLVS